MTQMDAEFKEAEEGAVVVVVVVAVVSPLVKSGCCS
jgi:hypothetical protein